VDRFFPYDVDRRFLPVWLACGLKEGKDGVTIADDGTFLATLGWFRLLTTVDNVDGAHVTRDYRWWTAVGPRLSMADDGITFGTNARAGVCVHFRERVRRVVGPRAHSALTVTVADPEGLVALLGEARPR
jgi:hypothetical protein